MKRKGLALPIEMIVIVAIAVLVLVVIAAFFVGGIGQLSVVGDGSAFGTGCDRLRLVGCEVDPNVINIGEYNEPQKSSLDPGSTRGSLQRACYNLNRIVDTSIHPQSYSAAQQCRVACGCPAGLA